MFSKLHKRFFVSSAVVISGGVCWILLNRGETTKETTELASTYENRERVPLTEGYAHGTAPLSFAKKRMMETPSQNIDPAKASMLLSEAKSIANLDDRAKFAADIIRSLCLNGYSAEAWDLIEESGGQVRNFQLTAFFQSAQLDDSVLKARLSAIGDKLDTTIGFSAYLTRFEAGELDNLVTNPDFRAFLLKIKPNLYSDGLSKALSGLFQKEVIMADKRSISSLGKAALELHSQGILAPEGLAHIVEKDKWSSPFEKWMMLSEIAPDTMKRGETATIRTGVILEMVKTDAPKAMESLMSTVDGDLMRMDLQRATVEWTVLDSKGAFEWYLARESSLDTAQRDAVTLGFFKAAVEFNDLEVAASWAERVESVQLREAAIKVIDARTRQPKKQ